MNGAVYVLAVFLSAASPSPTGDFDLGRYDTAVECDLQARSVRVRQAGARLRCVRQVVEPAPASSWAAVTP